MERDLVATYIIVVTDSQAPTEGPANRAEIGTRQLVATRMLPSLARLQVEPMTVVSGSPDHRPDCWACQPNTKRSGEVVCDGLW